MRGTGSKKKQKWFKIISFSFIDSFFNQAQRLNYAHYASSYLVLR